MLMATNRHRRIVDFDREEVSLGPLLYFSKETKKSTSQFLLVYLQKIKFIRIEIIQFIRIEII